MKSMPLPRILLVEDDPVSRAFLVAAAQATPAEVDSADSVAAAIALVGAQPVAVRCYDLWLFDANLPDSSGAALLAHLRLRDPDTPALAHTATQDREALDALIAAGFSEVLVKPLPAAAVKAAIQRVLGIADVDNVGRDTPTACAKYPVWDDEAAARALNGNRAHIATLRVLFVGELPGLRQRMIAHARGGELEQVRGELHKLRASCGFVGAARLGAAVQALHHETDSPALLARFDEAAQDTLDQFEPSS